MTWWQQLLQFFGGNTDNLALVALLALVVFGVIVAYKIGVPLVTEYVDTRRERRKQGKGEEPESITLALVKVIDKLADRIDRATTVDEKVAAALDNLAGDSKKSTDALTAQAQDLQKLAQQQVELGKQIAGLPDALKAVIDEKLTPALTEYRQRLAELTDTEKKIADALGEIKGIMQAPAPAQAETVPAVKSGEGKTDERTTVPETVIGAAA